MGRRIGDILIEERLITPAQRDEALRRQKLYGGRIGTNLVELGAVELEALTRALARQKAVPAALQKHFDSIHREAVGLVPAQLAQKHWAIPLGFTSRNPKTLAVAFVDPAKPGAIDEIQFAASARIYPVIAPELRILLYLEKIYGIPLQVRFQRMELANLEAAGRWRPAAAPAAKQPPADLSPPEITPPGSIPAPNPQAFFDMTRPDLSQPRTNSAILLTQAVPPSDPTRSPAEQATAKARTAPGSGKTASQSQSSLGKAAVSAKTAVSSVAAKPGPSAAEASPASRGQPTATAAAAAQLPQTEATARKPTRESTPPPLPVPESRRRSSSTSSQPAAIRAQTASSTQPHGAAPTAPSAKPKPSTPPSVAKADSPRQRADRSDAPSSAPTIQDIPALDIDLETPTSTPTPGPLGSDYAKAAVEPASAPTIKIDFDPSGEPLPQGTTRQAAAAPGAPSPDAKLVSKGTRSAATSTTERTLSAAASEIRASFPSLPIDELWGTPGDAAIEAGMPDEPRPTASSAIESAPSATPAGAMPDLPTRGASILPNATASASAPSKTSGEVTTRPWSATEAVDAMAVASSRDQIADAIVNYLRSICGVGLVMIVQHEVAMGWKGFAPGLDADAIASLGLPLAAPSILQVAFHRQTIFSGSPPAEGAQLDHHLWEVLGSPAPKEAIVAPIIIRDRVVNLIYGHAADGGPLPDRALVQIGMLCRAAAAAYVRLIQASKAKSS